MAGVTRVLSLLSALFPVWVLLACALAMFHPEWFTWFSGPWIIWGLGVIMLGMGITLSVEDFRGVLKMPRAVAIGFAAQFLIMPFWGWTIGKVLQLETPYAVGLILVASCPGGTASNVVAYLARANVALSVIMTMCSTAGAIVLTPVLTEWLAGQYVPVDGLGLFLDMLKIVLLPLVLGVTLNHFLPRLVRVILPVGPLISVIVVAMICASILGKNVSAVIESGRILLPAVFLLHACAFASGYGFAKCFRCGRIAARTISIEVGMQNSGLASVLATNHFANPLTAVPCAMSAFMHSVIGSVLAGIWRNSASAEEKPLESVAISHGAPR